MGGVTQPGNRVCPCIGALKSSRQMAPPRSAGAALVAALGNHKDRLYETRYWPAFSSSLRMLGFTLPGCGGGSSANPAVAAARLLSVWPKAR
jgi:hypothetical protein